ncbi:MAG: 2-succinyl-5-enolpyruvyl-6-hydroxy-3-cyclohexene-1-carboxylic-acid synthase [Pseudobdellovibrionaceae bacterium]
MKSLELAHFVLQNLVNQGVREFCLCAGARNSPLVLTLEKSKELKLFHFFDERSASFFALGRISRTHQPVAVVTTSGTAVSEMLSACVEANYSSLPLVLLTADRPRSYRKTGAPQTIEQVGIFGTYTDTCLDIEATDEPLDFSLWSRQRPLHVNVCFDEPLYGGVPQEIGMVAFEAKFQPSIEAPSTQRTLKNPLVIAGPLAPDWVGPVTEFLVQLDAPIYAETLSQLRGESRLQHLLLKGGEKSVEKAFQLGKAQSILRIGGVPTLRFWRELEGKYSQIPVAAVAANDYRGLSRASLHLIGHQSLRRFKSEKSAGVLDEMRASDQELRSKIQSLIEKYPLAEPSWMFHLNQKVQNQNLYLGNSLPIREWDLVPSVMTKYASVFGHRGANGIDGQISSFFGFSDSSQENWCVIGDLTALYDLNALWISGQLESAKHRLVVINNGGGMIFKNIQKSEIFLNRHQLQFQKWAEMFSWSYLKIEKPEHLKSLPDSVILEVQPDEKQSELWWSDYQKL